MWKQFTQMFWYQCLSIQKIMMQNFWDDWWVLKSDTLIPHSNCTTNKRDDFNSWCEIHRATVHCVQLVSTECLTIYCRERQIRFNDREIAHLYFPTTIFSSIWFVQYRRLAHDIVYVHCKCGWSIFERNLQYFCQCVSIASHSFRSWCAAKSKFNPRSISADMVRASMNRSNRLNQSS